MQLALSTGGALAVQIQAVCGEAILPWLDQLAQLRIQVFRDWPYLYDGSVGYEREYLQAYVNSQQGLMVLATDGAALVGASSGLPMRDADPDFRKPFTSSSPRPDGIFYFGESVLDAAYRGQGLGHRFFDCREEFARARGFAFTAFCAVQRPPEHPMKPAQARDLAPFWRARGYEPLPGKVCTFRWQDIGESEETIKPMQFWGKCL